MNKCIRMGITASNLSFGEVNRRFYGRKLRFTAPLTRRRKTKFPTVKPPIYLPKWQIWMQLSPNYKLMSCQISMNVAPVHVITEEFVPTALEVSVVTVLVQDTLAVIVLQVEPHQAKKNALEHAQNVRSHIIMHMCNVLSGLLLSIDTFFSSQLFLRGQRRFWSDRAAAQSDLSLRCPHLPRRYIFAWRG